MGYGELCLQTVFDVVYREYSNDSGFILIILDDYIIYEESCAIKSEVFHYTKLVESDTLSDLTGQELYVELNGYGNPTGKLVKKDSEYALNVNSYIVKYR